MQTPTLRGEFIYKNVKYHTNFYSLIEQEIPNLPWSQVYIIGNFQNLVPIVKYTHASDNLPGGGVKSHESIFQTINREAKEELNMAVKSWFPLGYQRVYDDQGNEGFQLRVYAELKKLGEFTNDPDGSVIGYELINIEELNTHIHYGEIGDFLIKQTKHLYK
jgi:NUDIX domain